MSNKNLPEATNSAPKGALPPVVEIPTEGGTPSVTTPPPMTEFATAQVIATPEGTPTTNLVGPPGTVSFAVNELRKRLPWLNPVTFHQIKSFVCCRICGEGPHILVLDTFEGREGISLRVATAVASAFRGTPQLQQFDAWSTGSTAPELLLFCSELWPGESELQRILHDPDLSDRTAIFLPTGRYGTLAGVCRSLQSMPDSIPGAFRVPVQWSEPKLGLLLRERLAEHGVAESEIATCLSIHQELLTKAAADPNGRWGTTASKWALDDDTLNGIVHHVRFITQAALADPDAVGLEESLMVTLRDLGGLNRGGLGAMLDPLDDFLDTDDHKHLALTSIREVADPGHGLSDVFLSDACRGEIQRFLDAIRLDGTLMGDWGLDAERLGLGRHVALFHGINGTGKTMAAQAIAHELGRPLVMVNPAALTSSYVNETEIKITKMFEGMAKEGTNRVFVMDEADGFLVDRAAASSIPEYYASMVNAVLRALDSFKGILVMTSNLPLSLDPSIARRIPFKIHFEAPSKEARLSIWERFWSEKIPVLEPIALAAIASDYVLSGGQIKNAFRVACLDAAKKGGMDMAILHSACQEAIQSTKALSKDKDRKVMGFTKPLGDQGSNLVPGN